MKKTLIATAGCLALGGCISQQQVLEALNDVSTNEWAEIDVSLAGDSGSVVGVAGDRPSSFLLALCDDQDSELKIGYFNNFLLQRGGPTGTATFEVNGVSTDFTEINDGWLIEYPFDATATLAAALRGDPIRIDHLLDDRFAPVNFSPTDATTLMDMAQNRCDVDMTLLQDR